MFNSTIITGDYTAIEGLRLLLELEHPDESNVFCIIVYSYCKNYVQ